MYDVMQEINHYGSFIDNSNVSFIIAENLVPCQTFVESHALGFVLASLSSHHDDVRRAGYHVLSCFIQHLEGARFRGRREVGLLKFVLLLLLL